MKRRAEALAAFVLAGCTWFAIAPSEAHASDLRVGSKRFAESMVLGEIATQTARASGETATHDQGLGGTAIVLAALEAGSIDLYPEYIGTLKETLLHDPRATDDALEKALAAASLAMTAPLGFEDKYALALPRDAAVRLNIARISDLAAHDDLRVAVSHEFLGRSDGWKGLVQAYDLHAFRPQAMDHGLAYQAAATHSVDVVDAYTTDAALAGFNLLVLDDDRHFFPSYAAVFLHRVAARKEHPSAFAAVDALAGRIDVATMTRLNGQMELHGQTAAAVANAWLHPHALPNGQMVASAREDSFARGLFDVIREQGLRHLLLVALSLLLATALGIPLGILAHRSRRLGALVLGFAGLVQTIPSLALLCFMIPLVGIGLRPALAALFLYGLLPIARNTLTGLAAIPPELVESAEALGLPPRTVLVRLSLPMASPVILAGVKTSAVLAVGTATLAAFVGAGGFGVPISTGLGLNDTRLILQGAIPAALLAVFVQMGFAGLERLIVPRGLRRRPGNGSAE